MDERRGVGPEAMVDARKLIEDWREELASRDYIGTPRVQDQLLSLWGEMSDAGSQLVGTWLSITPHRELFSSEELRAMLDEVEALLDAPPVNA